MEDFDQIKHLVLRQLNRCVVCHREYEVSDISSVQRKPGVWTLMVECEQCRSRNYIAAVTQDGNPEEAMFEVRSLTERALQDVSTTSTESEDATETPPQGATEVVSASDVLEMHEFLKDFDGNFERLFRSG